MANRERIRGNVKIYVEKNKEKLIAYRKEYRKRNPNLEKERDLQEKFGISLQEYNRQFQIQGGMCKICEVHQSKLRRSLAVDHCHTKGHIRGLLCDTCNLGIGYFKDSFELLEKAAMYILGEPK